MDETLHALVVALVNAIRDLPTQHPATAHVRHRAIALIAHLVDQQLLAQGTWYLGAR